MICDLAETYHILNYEELPPLLVATLVFGLKPDSRLNIKMRGDTLSTTMSLQAMMVDALNWIVWSKTADAEDGINRPESVFDKLRGIKKESETLSFESADDFEEYRKAIINGY